MSQPRTSQERRADNRRQADQLPANCQLWIQEGVASGVKEGVKQGLKEVFSDSDFCEKFWLKGHEICMEKTERGFIIWFGKKAMTWLLSILAAGIGSMVIWYLAVRYGVKV